MATMDPMGRGLMPSHAAVAPGPTEDDERPSRMARLFQLRHAERMGQMNDADRAEFDELSAFGEGMGVARTASPAQPMPGQPVTSGAAVPAGDALSAMVPPLAGSRPTGQTEAMRMRADPAAPGASGSGMMKRSGIPALDALATMPAKRSRGLYHNRKLGRVLGGSGGGSM